MASRIKSSLPDVDLNSFVVLTVDAGDPGAVITGFTIHVNQDVPDIPTEIKLLPPLLALAPQREAPGFTPG